MATQIPNEQLIQLYETMLKIRTFEGMARDLFAQAKMPGFVHLYLGEEAVAAGACANLGPKDFITSTHRGHGHVIAKGGDMNQMMAELYGKGTGYCKGKGGSMHIADVDLGILGANGIVGGGPPLAVGAALSCQYKGTGGAVICFFGDGASNQGTTHEGMNMAAIWKLPVVFLCENNLYGISLASKFHQTVTDVADRANAYDIPGIVVDGNDVMAVYEAVGKALERAREGKGPSIVECKTYRHRGHFEGDPANYRPQDEVQAWLKKDPIPRYEGQLKEMGVLTEAQIGEIKARIQAEVQAAVDFAENSPWPSVDDLMKDVYTGEFSQA